MEVQSIDTYKLETRYKYKRTDMENPDLEAESCL